MPSIADIFFMASLDDSRLQVDAKRAGDKAGTTMGKGISASIKKSMSGMKGGLLGGLGLGAGLGAVNLLSGALSGVVKGIEGTIDAASDQREAMALNSQVFDKSAGEMEAWSDTAAASFGESKTAAMNFAAGFGNTLKSAGMSMDEVAAKSRELTERAADLGSAFNASGQEVATALKAGLVGESEPLRRFGILLSDAAVKAEAVASGVAVAGEELTEGQKVLARYNLILKQSSSSAGMFGRDTDSLADAQKSLDATMADLAAEIGTELVPVMADFANTIREDIIPAARDLVGALEGPVGAFLELAGGMHGVSPASDQLVEDFYKQKKATADAAVATDALYERLEANRLKLYGVGGALRDTTPYVRGFYKQVDLARVGIDKMTDALRTNAAILNGQATAALDSYYGTLDERTRLSAVKHELADLRKAMSSGKVTDEMKADLRDLEHEQEAILTSLATKGEVSIITINGAIDRWIAKSAEARGAVKADADAMVRYWLRVKATVLAATGALPKSYGLNVPGVDPRAAGGPVTAGKPYWVGELGPELIVPRADAVVIPNDRSMALASQSTASTTNNINVRMDAAPAARNPFEVATQLRRLGDFGVLGGKKGRSEW